MAIAKNPKVIMTSEQFVSRLKNLVERKTYYSKKHPDNCCYIHKDGRTSADCLNLIKSVLNGYNVYNNTFGYYQQDLANTGDCSETELLCQCDEITDDFSQMGDKPRILWMNKPNGHVGVYLGQEVTIDGKVYNVIECSSGWKGITYSYVDADGTRRKYRGAVKNCKWMKNGLPNKWVSFNATQGSNSSEKPKDYKTIAQEVLNGKWGNGDIRKARLKRAGYSDDEIKKIQSIVNDLCKKPIPDPTLPPEVWHTVKKGEIASVIAKNYKTTMSQLKKLNPSIKNWDLIYPNQKIRIK